MSEKERQKKRKTKREKGKRKIKESKNKGRIKYRGERIEEKGSTENDIEKR